MPNTALAHASRRLVVWMVPCACQEADLSLNLEYNREVADAEARATGVAQVVVAFAWVPTLNGHAIARRYVRVDKAAYEANPPALEHRIAHTAEPIGYRKPTEKQRWDRYFERRAKEVAEADLAHRRDRRLSRRGLDRTSRLWGLATTQFILGLSARGRGDDRGSGIHESRRRRFIGALALAPGPRPGRPDSREENR